MFERDDPFAEVPLRAKSADDAVGATRLEPLPLLSAVAAEQPYPIDALGPFMRGAVEAIAVMAFVPHSMAAASILSACSLAIQGHRDVKLPIAGGTYRPTSLNMVTVAESGERKSTSDDLAMEAVADYERELSEAFAERKTAASAEMDAWNEAYKAAKRTHKDSSKEMMADALKEIGPKPADILEPLLVARKGTTEGLVKQLEKGRPSMGLMSDEGGSWLGGYGMSEEHRLHTISTLSDCWDGKPLQRLTSGEGSSLVYGRRLAFHLMLQPMISKTLMGDPMAKSQGFLSRILPSQPTSLAGTRFVDPHKPIDLKHENAMRAFGNRLGLALRHPLPFNVEKNALRPDHIWLAEPARLSWWSFYNEIEGKVGEGGEYQEIRGFAGKVAEHAARLASVVALFEQGFNTKAIDEAAMASGIALARYYLSEAARIIGVAPIDPSMVLAQAMSDWLKTVWTENLISTTAVHRYGPPHLRLGADRVRGIMAILERHDHVAQAPEGGLVRGQKVRQAWRVLNRGQAR